jgi:nucleoside 2-deoxyribosyltransferase
MMTKPKVYLAGPWVFAQHPAEISDRLARLCETAGLVAMLPYEEMPDTKSVGASTICRENTNRIRTADAVVADISPFRGPHMDPGTAMEIGYAAALGKPVFAYTNSPGPLIQRIRCEDTGTGWRDANGSLVEDFGLPDNLMIGCTLAAPVSFQASEAIDAAARWLHSVRQKDHER